MQHALTHNKKSSTCLAISDVRSCNDGLQKAPQNQTRYGSLLKVVKGDGFSSCVVLG